MAKLPPHPVVVFTIPTSVPQIIIAAGAIVSDITQHIASYTISPPILASIGTNIQALATAESNLINGSGSAANRDLALALVIADINMLKLVVQTAVNANPAQADALAENASMRIKISSSRQKVVFHAKNSLASGVVELYAPGFAGRCFHEWAMSPDGINWTPLMTTLKASTGLAGLTPMTRQYFRHRLTTVNEGTGSWDQSFGIIII